MILELARAATFALILAPALAAPAVAGPNETAFMERLVGTWNGKGKVTGAEAGTVTCRLTIRPSGERLNFQGRCAYSGGSMSQSISGRISYDDARGVFVSSSGGQSVAGKKSGNNLTFTSTQRNVRGSVTSTMTLSPSALKVQFEVTEARSGDKSRGSIPFTKS